MPKVCCNRSPRPLLTACGVLLVLFLNACAADNSQQLAQAIADYNAGRFTTSLNKANAARLNGSRSERQNAAYVGGLAAAKLDRNATAQKLFEEAADSSNAILAARANVSLGTVLLEEGQPLEAARAFDRARPQLKGSDANRALYQAGVAYREAGYAETARRRFASAAQDVDSTLASQASNAIKATGFAIQAGAYSNRSNATRCAVECSTAATRIGLEPARIVPIRRGSKTLYAVQIGNFSTRADAEIARRRLGSIEGTITSVERIAVPEN